MWCWDWVKVAIALGIVVKAEAEIGKGWSWMGIVFFFFWLGGVFLGILVGWLIFLCGVWFFVNFAFQCPNCRHGKEIRSYQNTKGLMRGELMRELKVDGVGMVGMGR